MFAICASFKLDAQAIRPHGEKTAFQIVDFLIRVLFEVQKIISKNLLSLTLLSHNSYTASYKKVMSF